MNAFASLATLLRAQRMACRGLPPPLVVDRYKFPKLSVFHKDTQVKRVLVEWRDRIQCQTLQITMCADNCMQIDNTNVAPRLSTNVLAAIQTTIKRSTTRKAIEQNKTCLIKLSAHARLLHFQSLFCICCFFHLFCLNCSHSPITRGVTDGAEVRTAPWQCLMQKLIPN